MEQPAYGSAKIRESPPRNGDDLLALHEILFSLNLACAFVYASLVYISQNQAPWVVVNDSTYYFFRGAFRINDFLHFPSTNSVSTRALAREFPSRWSQAGDDLLILVTAFGVAALVLLLLRLVAGTPAYRLILSGVAGLTAIFAIPAFYLCVLRLTLAWPKGPISAPSKAFLQSAPFITFLFEILCFGILYGISRKRSIPTWTWNTLLCVHCGLWVFILLPGIQITMYRLYAPYFLLLVFPLSGIVWLRYLKGPHLHAAATDGRGRVGKWALATVVVSIALLTPVWVLGVGKSMAQAKNMDSLIIQMSRGRCFGSCPSYTITVHGNGQIEYVGETNVKVRGSQTGAINQQQLTQVLRSLDRVHFFTLEDRAFAWCFDTASVAISVSVDGRTKRVVSDDSCTGAKSGLQAQFVKGADEIETIIGSARWVRCDGHCRP